MIAPVKYYTINVHMDFALGLSLKTWRDTGARGREVGCFGLKKFR